MFSPRKKRSQKPKLIDSLVLGVPSDVLSLPRAQFSWRRDWNWEEPVGTGLGNAHGETGQMDHVPQSSEIQLKSFGETPRSTVSNTRLGSHNPGFISD
ncbi:hypothetical protein XELAEV_18032589mg [Xenopus laevis]|uniref:Uncharacterized protein n=1 Tax=Xenopus laevis TaxID=8355 RepID=A0A974CHZ4_XENLA|nr:hypothetical protein XELAEV_18032589mg [Xenopus laevis]